ncbi:hypothetical protein Tco_1070102 [Tanacetum coccineum]|uniref:Uncharacterized protein n=1 Tax=Tanacetum coccineum TaxID=301880 RepID=A0ABQ5HKF9_9ASTR
MRRGSHRRLNLYLNKVSYCRLEDMWFRQRPMIDVEELYRMVKNRYSASKSRRILDLIFGEILSIHWFEPETMDAIHRVLQESFELLSFIDLKFAEVTELCKESSSRRRRLDDLYSDEHE